MYRVKDVMTEEVLACAPTDSLEKAVRMMKDLGCGCVPVVDERSHVVGLLTDRDSLMCALRLGERLGAIQVKDACSHSIICCEAEDTLERAEILMRVNHVRRLPVLGPKRELIGVVSLSDLARHVELSAVEGGSGLSPRHIALVLAETSGVRRPSPSGGEAPRDPDEKQNSIERIFHG